MKKTIRFKLFLAINGLVIFFVVFSWIMNIRLLDTYYIWQKKSILQQSYKDINRIYRDNPSDLDFQLELLNRTKGIHIIILDNRLNIKYNSSRFMDGARIAPFSVPVDLIMKSKRDDILNGKKIIGITMDRRLKTNFISFIAAAWNGDFIILDTPITAIRESTHIANTFFLFVGFATIMLGSIFAIFFSKSFSKPILQLNSIAQKMAKLDFSQKYVVTTEDEVGELGKSINSLSTQLDISISELKEANVKLQQDVEKERKIDEMRKEFISNVSHELKTPIALIKGYAEGLRLNINEDEESKNFYCDVIDDETDKMDKLVKDLLGLSQIESGFFKLEKTNFDIGELLDRVTDKYKNIIMDRDIQLAAEITHNIIVNADSLRIEQVISNYINNALDHIENEGLLKIGVRRDNDKALIYVYNSGKQINKDEMDKIWTSFYKIDKARTRAYGGVGLGLAIVKSIMDLHHNGYGVTNTDNGVEFWFRLDISQ